MPTGFRNPAGVDLEDLFETGTIQIAGFRDAAGANLRFAARGSATKIADVGFRDSAGSDVSNTWLGKGSAPPVLGFNGQSYAASAIAPTGATAAPTARLALALASDGTWNVTRTVSGSTSGNGSTVVASGSWLPSGQSAADYQVQFVGTQSGAGGVINGATTFQPLSTSRSISITVTTEAASSNSEFGTLGVSCALRRLSNAPSVSACALDCSATGYL